MKKWTSWIADNIYENIWNDQKKLFRYFVGSLLSGFQALFCLFESVKGRLLNILGKVIDHEAPTDLLLMRLNTSLLTFLFLMAKMKGEMGA